MTRQSTQPAFARCEKKVKGFCKPVQGASKQLSRQQSAPSGLLRKMPDSAQKMHPHRLPSNNLLPAVAPKAQVLVEEFSKNTAFACCALPLPCVCSHLNAVATIFHMSLMVAHPVGRMLRQQACIEAAAAPTDQLLWCSQAAIAGGQPARRVSSLRAAVQSQRRQKARHPSEP